MNSKSEGQFTDAFTFQFDAQEALLGRDAYSSISPSWRAAHVSRGGKARDGEALAFCCGNVRGETILEFAFLVQNRREILFTVENNNIGIRKNSDAAGGFQQTSNTTGEFIALFVDIVAIGRDTGRGRRGRQGRGE